MRRHLHPLVLCAPFPHRTFYKPLGYAGDYEMVNMIARDGHDGGSLYAKIVNCWFLKQAPSEAHRNRLRYLENKLLEETLRVIRAERQPRICNLACGPAVEVQRFLGEQTISDQAHFTLIDFNDETREHVLFFFKQKTAYEIGLGIPAEPLFRSRSQALSSGNAAAR